MCDRIFGLLLITNLTFMKKIISFAFACILLSVLFTSCKPGMLIKRHYNNGYYIAKNDRAPSRSTNSVTTNSPQRLQKSAYSVRTQPAQTESGRYDNGSAVAEVERGPAPEPATANKPVYKNKPSAAPITKSNAYTINKPVANETVRQKLSGDAASDGLSLFWIVILVILILWAIAFIAGGFGLGNLIHILLIIALVLFILWLLRIL